MLNNREIQLFWEGRLEIDCPQMTLVGCADVGQREISGPGTIYQTENRQLVFKLSGSTPHDTTDTLNRIFLNNNRQAGKLIPEEEFYSLTAVDSKGRTWNAQRLLLDVSYNLDVGTAIWKGNIDQLECTEALKTPVNSAYLNMQFAGKFHIPFNQMTEINMVRGGRERLVSAKLDTLVFTSGDAEFGLVFEDVRLTLEAKFPTDISSDFRAQVLRALQFVLGQEVYWEIMWETRGLKRTIILQSPRPASMTQSAARPPIHTANDSKGHWFVELFDKYLRFSLTNSRDEVHQLYPHIRAAIRGNVSSPHAKALAVSVAIEGVLRDAYKEVGLPQENLKAQVKQWLRFLRKFDASVVVPLVQRLSENKEDEAQHQSKREREQLRLLQTFLDEWQNCEDLRKRVAGAIGHMRKPRPLDQLRELAKKGIVADEQVDVWKKLRNTSAHAEWKKRRKTSTHADLPDSLSVQDLVTKGDALVVLLYHLVFYKIGYCGKYTDYGAIGWPLRDFSSIPSTSGHSNVNSG